MFYPFDDDPPRHREQPAGALSGVPYGRTTAAARCLRELSSGAGQRGESHRALERRRRNLVIRLCHEVGLSNRAIARVMSQKASEAMVRKVLKEEV